MHARGTTVMCPDDPFTINFADAPEYHNIHEPLILRPDIQMTPMFLRFSRCTAAPTFEWSSPTLGGQFAYAINGTTAQRELQVNAGQFKNNMGIIFKLTMTWCRCTNDNSVVISGNTPPTGSEFNLPPALTGGSRIAVSAPGWDDEHRPLTFKFGYLDPQLNNALITLDVRDANETEFFVPAVTVATAITFVLLVEDFYGAQSRVTVTRTVTPSGLSGQGQVENAIVEMLKRMPSNGADDRALINRAGVLLGAAKLLNADKDKLVVASRQSQINSLLTQLTTGFQPPDAALASYTSCLAYLSADTEAISESIYLSMSTAVNTVLGNTDILLNGAATGLYITVNNLMTVLRQNRPALATAALKFETAAFKPAEQITSLIDFLYRTHARETRGFPSRLDTGTAFSSVITTDTFSMQSVWYSSWSTNFNSLNTVLRAEVGTATASPVVPVLYQLQSMPWPGSVLMFTGAISLRFDPFRGSYSGYPTTLAPVVHFGLRDESGKEVVGGEGTTFVPATSNATASNQGVYARMSTGRWRAMTNTLCLCELTEYALVPSYFFNSYYTHISLPLAKETTLLTRPEDDDAPGWAIMLICVFGILFGAALLMVCLLFALLKKVKPPGPLVGRVPGMDEAFYHEGSR